MNDNNIHTGDKEIINYLFEKYFPRGCEYANSIISNSDASYDIVQNLFIKFWEKDLKFDNVSCFKSYLYNSIKNACINYIKNKKSIDNSLLESLEQSAEYFIIDKEIKSELLQAIDFLPKNRKKVILLRLKDYSIEEIAKELNISYNTVKSHNQLANKQLRILLKNLYVLF